MPERTRRPTVPSSPSRSGEYRRGDFYLEVNGKEHAIREGRYMIGRGPACDIQLDSPLVSRAHAAIGVTNGRATIEDLKSRNGVFLNGVLVKRPVPLDPGDRLRIGDRDLVLRQRRRDEQGGRASNLPLAVGSLDDRAPAEEKTIHADALELLRITVHRLVSAGDVAEAEAVVAGHLTVLLGEARLAGTLPAEKANTAARHGLLLAASTGNGGWIDYVVELYLTAHLLMPAPTVHELFAISSKARMKDKRVLRRYLDFLRRCSDDLGPDAASVLSRLERFHRL